MGRLPLRIVVPAVCLSCLALLLAACGSSTDPYGDPPVLLPTDLWGITASGTLVHFHLEEPGTVLDHKPLTGLASGDALVALSSRGDYALGRQSRLYALDREAGTLTQAAGMPFSPPLTGECFDLDGGLETSPVVVMEGGRRQSAADGTLLADYGYAPSDPNASRTPDLAGYVATDTVFVDVANDVLAELRFDATLAGDALRTVGPLGVDMGCRSGLAFGSQRYELRSQLSPPSSYLLVLVGTPPGETATRIYAVDRYTGEATPKGTIGWSEPIVDVTFGWMAL